ncbi:MAG: DUF2975 domain-containing protein [Balneolaceae bacterium]|nr:DUF2975 domain-containing protein [Balneolaceae bacterium]
MGLKNDWSLAHFLYYTTWLGAITSVVAILVVLLLYYQSAEDALLVFPQIDPLVELRELEIDDEQLVSETGHYLMPLKMYVNVGYASFDEDLSATNLYILLLRILKFSCLLGFLLLLSQILKSVIDKQPFANRNSVRLLWMGGILIGYSVIDSILGFSIASSLNDINFQSGIHFKPIFNLDQYIYLGLILFVLGYVFKEATRIHEEQKLVV